MANTNLGGKIYFEKNRNPGSTDIKVTGRERGSNEVDKKWLDMCRLINKIFHVRLKKIFQKEWGNDIKYHREAQLKKKNDEQVDVF